MANQRTAFEREETRLLAGVDYLEILAGEYAVEHAIALAAAHAALAAHGGPTADVVRELERLQAGVMVATEQLDAHRAAGVDGVAGGDGAAGPWVMEQVVPVVHGAADGGVGAMEVGAEVVMQQQQQEPGVGDAENVDPNAGAVVGVGVGGVAPAGDVVDDATLSSQEKKRRRLGGDVPVAAGEVAVVLAAASSSPSSTSSSGGSGAGGGGAGSGLGAGPNVSTRRTTASAAAAAAASS